MGRPIAAKPAAHDPLGSPFRYYHGAFRAEIAERAVEILFPWEVLVMELIAMALVYFAAGLLGLVPLPFQDYFDSIR